MALLPDLNPQAALYAAAIALLSYAIGIAVYRRFFHPLAKIPGPFLPAVTTLYQSYYNGRYFLKIAELHEKYGNQHHVFHTLL